MDTTRFKDTKTGGLIPIATPTGPDFAFLPDELPPKWFLPPHLVSKLVEARAALSLLAGIGRTLPEPDLLLVPLKRREAITSSRIEGTYATAEELMLFEMDADSKPKEDKTGSWREVYNYSAALTRGSELLGTLPVCGRVIKELHKTLMAGVRGQHSTAGEWRDYQVAIGSDRRYIPPPANEVSKCMDAFDKYVNSESAFDPLMRAYMVHYQFEAIHPFSDGNGRIGRVLLSLMIADWCSLTRPWLYMSEFFERYKDEYVDNMFKISSEGAWEKWIEFCLNGTIHQATAAISKCEKLRALREEMFERVHPSSSRTTKIINGLFKNPILRIADLRKQFDVCHQTAQSDITKLVNFKVLSPLTGKRPKVYFAPEIWTIAYSEQSNEI